IADMAFVLVVGIIVGTYSTVFVACAVVIALQKGKATNGD
ncbi:MAG: hypothetical protein KDD69_16835, partial [Bdellovibrionales bacterium]|nr:hypothetical protein [Bdellovibrionales bacterium]